MQREARRHRQIIQQSHLHLYLNVFTSCFVCSDPLWLIPPSSDSPPEQRQRRLLQRPAQRDRVARVGRVGLPRQDLGGQASGALRLHLEGRLQRDRPGHPDHLTLHGGRCYSLSLSEEKLGEHID